MPFKSTMIAVLRALESSSPPSAPLVAGLRAAIQAADSDAALEAALADLDAAFACGDLSQSDAEALAAELVQRGRELVRAEPANIIAGSEVMRPAG